MSNIHVSFSPGIPNDHMIPAVSPGHQEQVKGIVIVYVHTVIFHTALN